MIPESEAEKAVTYLRDTAPEAAKRRAERLYMEQWIKTVLAQQQARSSAKSAAASEIEARQSQPYLDALEAYREAIRLDEEMRFLRSAAETKTEVWRSQEASSRRGHV